MSESDQNIDKPRTKLEDNEILMPLNGRILLGAYLLALILFLSHCAVKLWPKVEGCPDCSAMSNASAPVGESKSDQTKTEDAGKESSSPRKFIPEPVRPVSIFGNWITFPVSQEVRLMLIVFTIGALGGCANAVFSFVAYVGNANLHRSWTWYYVLWPPGSAAVALIIYFAIRGGFFSSSSAANVNDFGIAAVSGVVGMFSRKATWKLKEVFATFLSDSEDKELKDKVETPKEKEKREKLEAASKERADEKPGA
jgi:hypothetical protein